ncbi:E3 ubiquitin-protein ligase RING1-like [Melia azedarach]|uniref:E3 ubiquitin-protein ligase RING1-like n=1 Tax=Melia azedarach TaxID=155640 RepID=A0ACC1XE64_MELAZ|nr:E3 ubiquitin-protein ligase RING1-like [Melia azedarach]
MVIMKEEAHATSIQVFRWNEKLPKRAFSDCMGLLTLTFQNSFNLRTPGKFDKIEKPSWPRKLTPFHLHYLFARDSFQAMLLDLLLRTGYFLPDSAHSLASQISKYLFSNYRLPLENLSELKRDAMTVIVVEVHRTRIVHLEHAADDNQEYFFPDPDPGDFPTPDDSNHDIFVTEKGEKYPVDIDDDKNPDDLTVIMRRYLGVRKRIPTYPILISKPVGLIEVKPEQRLKIFQAFGGRAVNGSCSICLQCFSDGMELVETACSHVFHENCVYNLLSTKNSCPICTSDLFSVQS